MIQLFYISVLLYILHLHLQREEQKRIEEEEKEQKRIEEEEKEQKRIEEEQKKEQKRIEDENYVSVWQRIILFFLFYTTINMLFVYYIFFYTTINMLFVYNFKDILAFLYLIILYIIDVYISINVNKYYYEILYYILLPINIFLILFQILVIYIQNDDYFVFNLVFLGPILGQILNNHIYKDVLVI